jgi:hypothetical protein
MPAYVEREFRRYLECGILAYGFARARCPDCRAAYPAARHRGPSAPGSGASAQARFGAVSFIHRFGASLNRHVHYHCCVIDGVFEPVEEAGDVPQSVRFRPAAELTPEAVAAITEQVRVRVLRWFARSGLIERDDVREMLAWENSGFSLDAAVRVGAHDRAGLERLLRYCARPTVRARASGAARRRTRRLPVAQATA